jgi:hypothetical protein
VVCPMLPANLGLSRLWRVADGEMAAAGVLVVNSHDLNFDDLGPATDQ